MRKVERLASGRWKVRYRRNGTETSQSFDADDRKSAARFAALLDMFDTPQQALDQLYEEGRLRNIPTLNEVAADHIDHLEGGGHAHRIKSRRLWDRTWGPRIGTMPANTITRDHLIRALDDLATNGQAPGRGYSRKSLYNQRGLLYGVLERCVAKNYLQANPGTKLKLPEVTVAIDMDDEDDAAEMVCLTPAEFDALYNTTSPHYQPFIRFLVGTGARWGEAVVLRAGDVNLAAGTLRIRRALKWSPDGQHRIGPPKKNSQRTIWLGAEITTDLRPLIAGKQPTDLVFTAPKGGRINHRTFWSDHWRPSIWRAQHCSDHTEAGCKCGTAHPKRCELHKGAVVGPCGCEGTLSQAPRLHDLRHSHASWLLGAGVPITVVQKRLGHKSITTTVDTYGHLLPDAQVAAAAAADAVFGASHRELG